MQHIQIHLKSLQPFWYKDHFSGMVFPIVLLVLLSILCSNLYVSWPFSIPRCHLTSIGIPIVAIKERQSHDCLIWLPIPVRCFLYIEPGTWTLSGILTCWMWLASLTFTLNSFHCGLVTSYGNIDLSQHKFSLKITYKKFIQICQGPRS